MKINEKNLSTFASTPPVDLDGWLNKRGEVNKSWQRRWFVLKGNLLFYFEKRGSEPLGVIILEGCTIELAEDGEQYCFKVIFHGEKDRSYWLAAETQELMEKWMKALTCAGYEYMKCMVAELQRQLEELEGSHKLVENGSGNSSSSSSHNNNNSSSRNGTEGSSREEPKAPPRRHNPFNRPAPAAPTITNGAPIRQKEFATQRQGELINRWLIGRLISCGCECLAFVCILYY